MKKAAELIFIPIPGIGHIVSTVEIAKLLLARDDNLFVTVLIMKFPFSSDGTDAYIASLSNPNYSETKRIKFINLPQQQYDGNGGAPSFFKFPGKHQSDVRDVVTKLLAAESETTRIAGFVVDMFCTDMIDVADELGLPSYMFYTSSAANLGLHLHLQALHDEENKDCTEFKNSDAELAVPSFVNPLPAARVFPSVFLDKESSSIIIEFARKIKTTKGILVNTFADLESHALRSLNSDRKFPPVYSVGPILNVSSEDNRVSSEHLKQKSDILGWLDDQPPSSVVFLCFGSMGSFAEDQVKEIAHAIENSGIRFLWTLRQPPKDKFGFPSDYADHGSVLPEGFLSRTTKIGKVIGWAPQVAILAHPAIGGFVSHCGWNSTLESLWFGVPIAAWPFFAEQQLNAFELVNELGLAVEIDISYRKDSGVIVSRQTIEKGISEVMEQDSEIRNKVKEMSKMSREALQPDGSSYSSLGRFINQIQNSLS